MKTLILITMLVVNSLFATTFSQQGMLGVWEISAEKDSGLVAWGQDRPKNRGETWTLDFNRQRIVVNRSKGSTYEYFVDEDGKLNIFKRKFKNNKRYSKITKKSRMYIVRKETGMYNGCVLIKIQTNMFTQYKSNRKYRMCKIQNESVPVYQTQSNSTAPDIFH